MVPYEFTFNSGYGKESVLYLYICFSDVLIYYIYSISIKAMSDYKKRLRWSFWSQKKLKVFFMNRVFAISSFTFLILKYISKVYFKHFFPLCFIHMRKQMIIYSFFYITSFFSFSSLDVLQLYSIEKDNFWTVISSSDSLKKF